MEDVLIVEGLPGPCCCRKRKREREGGGGEGVEAEGCTRGRTLLRKDLISAVFYTMAIA